MTQRKEAPPKTMTTTPTMAQALGMPNLPNRPEIMATKVAVQKGAPMVAQPRAMPFLRGNQLFIRVEVTIRPKALAMKVNRVRQTRNMVGELTRPKRM